MIVALRRLEHWLHQHIFKVGWLITQNYQTTTILFYTFFLPGVILHEVVLWLAAGVLDVRAERAIRRPAAQEIGELRLSFVRLDENANVYRRAIISLTPLLAGLLAIAIIANNVFDFQAAFSTMSSLQAEDMAAGLRQLSSAPDFWFWMYIVFTITNTMWPNTTTGVEPKIWRRLSLLASGSVIAAGSVIVLTRNLPQVIEPLQTLLGVFVALLLIMISASLFMTLILGSIEALIERFTQRNATFRDGKLVTITRAEMEAEKQQQREAAEQQRSQQQEAVAAEARTRSIYNTYLPIPGAPGRAEEITPLAPTLLDAQPQEPRFPLQSSNVPPPAPDNDPTQASATREPNIRLPGRATQPMPAVSVDEDDSEHIENEADTEADEAAQDAMDDETVTAADADEPIQPRPPLDLSGA